ncbi:hypothetical protein SK128_009928 [Halocaridina rubra]|uniref:Uncharacterized protein n=1 Tax=Halocaridina rubra TaxID=373956 RepID=A0AAN9A560_HALRR
MDVHSVNSVSPPKRLFSTNGLIDMSWVLPLKTGQQTPASSWLLESPGHIPNKFTTFVRIVYVIPSETEEVELLGDGNNTTSNEDGENETEETADTEGMDDAPENGERTENKNDSDNSGVENVPGVINIAPADEESSTDPVDDVHGKIFAPRLVSSGSWCVGDVFESLDQIVGRLNSWALASQGEIVTVHSQYMYYAV